MLASDNLRRAAAEVSVVICTHNRSALLRRAISGVLNQTLSASAIDLVVIDDGSTDDTATVVATFGSSVRYSYQRQVGLATAKTHGLFVSRAPLVLFADDDDIPEPSCVAEHVEWHRRYPDEGCAVLGHTDLATEVEAEPLMRFVTTIDPHLFSYGPLRHGQTLDFSGFWGGRTSAKRSFLLKYGVFDWRFTFGCEDIELGFRLSRHGLRVLYNRRAVTTMVRAFDVDGFCRRLWRQGRSNFLFSQLHPDHAVQEWTGASTSSSWRWSIGEFNRARDSARQLDRMTRSRSARGVPIRDDEWELLCGAYREAFDGAKRGGFLEAQQAHASRIKAEGLREP